MRVDDRNRTGAAPAEPGPAQESEKPGRNQGMPIGTAAPGKAGDRVEISSTLETLARAIFALGTERASRVPALAAEYLSGSYYADSAATAGSMVSEALL